MEGFISKIQRYATKDGPGLRTTVFLVGCNLDCLWCSNPELITAVKKYLYHPERCVKCGKCVSVATNDSITLTTAGCLIDRDRCTNLEECAASCYYDAYGSIGYKISAPDLFETLKRDKDFYDESGGGVTFSGGEAALQPDFLIEVAQLLHEEGIHITLDTAGLLPTKKMLQLVKYFDMVLYDIKAFNSIIHKKCTGMDNKLILQNAVEIAKKKIPMVIRLVIVPDYNDDKQDFKDRLTFIKTLGDAVKQIDILKYHKLAESKYLQMGLHNRMSGVDEPTDEYIHDYIQMAADMGIKVTLGG